MKAKLNNSLAVCVAFIVVNLCFVCWANFAINYSMLLPCGIDIRNRTFKTLSARTYRRYHNCDDYYFSHTTKI